MGRKIYSMTHKEEMIKIATQLCYPEEVITKLENAASDYECDRIMITARRNCGKKKH